MLLLRSSNTVLIIGEHLTEMELVECMMTLLGYSENPETDGCFTEDTETAIVNHVPERLSVTDFAEDLLGLSTWWTAKNTNNFCGSHLKVHMSAVLKNCTMCCDGCMSLWCRKYYDWRKFHEQNIKSVLYARIYSAWSPTARYNML